VSGERAVRSFEKAGWVKDRQRGSHVILVKPGHPDSLSVPQHREIANVDFSIKTALIVKPKKKP
jgi:predicted RNA binding protein YcfA (HicA-like mRNA interferase family)